MATLAVALLRCAKSTFNNDSSDRVSKFKSAVLQSASIMKPLKCDVRMFIAPEYYFSPFDMVGQHQPQIGPKTMSRSQKHSLYKSLKGLSADAGDLILIAGSIFYRKGTQNIRGLNVCPILRNGVFLRKYYKKFDDGAIAKEFGAASYHHKESDPVFTIKTVTFGVEVCGDHTDQNNNLKNWLAANPKTKDIDVQIMISDSNAPTAPNMIARAGGYFIHCDIAGEHEAALGVYRSAGGNWQQNARQTISPVKKFHAAQNMDVEVYKLTELDVTPLGVVTL